MKTWTLDMGVREVVIPATKRSPESRIFMRMIVAFSAPPQKVRRIKLRRRP